MRFLDGLLAGFRFAALLAWSIAVFSAALIAFAFGAYRLLHLIF
jgi:hypothetical protein